MPQFYLLNPPPLPCFVARDPMLLGSERLIASPRLNGLRVGVLANPASIDHGFRHVVDRLGASPTTGSPRSSARSTASGRTSRTT